MADRASFSWSYGGSQKRFTPPPKQWQTETARRLNIRVEYYMRYGGEKYFSQSSCPRLTASIKPDGNCFFRALSVIITGVEDSHMTIREAITKHVQQNSDIYRTFLQSRGGMENYVRSMRRPREWATDTEIFAAATFLKTIIEVCSHTRGRRGPEYHWQTFTPLNSQNPSLPQVYIFHKDEHFEPIIDIQVNR